MSRRAPRPAPERLTSRGLDRLMELIADAYGFDDLTAFRAGILPALQRAVPAAWRSYNEVGTDPAGILAISEPAAPPELLEAWTRLAHQHPVIDHVRRTGDGRPWRLSDFIGREELRRLDLYREVYAPMGVESQVAVTLPAAAPTVIGLALSRGREDFSDEECTILARARPHLIQAFRDAQLSGRREAVLAALGRGLDAQDRPTAVVAPDGLVLHVTAAAEPTLEALGTRAGRLSEPVRAALLAPPDAAGARTRTVALSAGGRTITARVLASASAAESAVVMFPAGDGGMGPAALAGLGLTSRQAQVLSEIALGRSVPEAARALGIAPRTAAKHLQLAYAKLGVASRSEAARTAWAAVSGGDDPALSAG